MSPTRCKQTLFGNGLKPDWKTSDCDDEKMRFAWIAIFCISAALAAVNVDEGKGEMVEQVEKS